MRKPIIAGNWKMFKTRDEALAFIYKVNEAVPAQEIVDSVICAPFTVLRCLVKRQGENLRIGAQNMHYGEHLEERETGKTETLLHEQLEKDLAGLTEEQVEKLVIAYEPIWAIGTGRTATNEVADETCGYIRSVVKELYGENAAEAIRIQYGGSVKVNNIEGLMAMPNIDGALIGGASLNPDDFIYFTNVAVRK